MKHAALFVAFVAVLTFAGLSHISYAHADSPPFCRPPIYKKFTLSGASSTEIGWLPCADNGNTSVIPKTIFNETLNETGYALARVRLTYKNLNTDSNPSSNNVYYWSTSVQVGSSVTARSHGDDICPMQTARLKTNLGYGLLTPTNSTIVVKSYAGHSACANDANGNDPDSEVKIFSGGTLEVWIEDPTPGCAGRDIGIAESYVDNSISYDADNRWYWPTTVMNKFLSATIPESPFPRAGIKIFGTVEGTPSMNPNTQCRAEVFPLSAELRRNEGTSNPLLSEQTLVMPKTVGMGHLVLSLEGSMLSSTTTTDTIDMWVRSHAAASAGVFSHRNWSGGMIGWVRASTTGSTLGESCVVNGREVAHNQSSVLYSSQQVAFGASCSPISQVRTCTDGVLSGGSSYIYDVCDMAKPNSTPYIYGADDLSSAEFSSSAVAPVLVVGTGSTADIRQWIGHSTCGSCGAGVTKTQDILISGSSTPHAVTITLKSRHASSNATYSASVVQGAAYVSSGGTKVFPVGAGSDTWTIQITPTSTPPFIIRLGNGLTSGSNYMYLDSLRVQITE
jgi:hypothetical protein